VLILGKVDSSLQISRKVYELIYELNLISPRILLTVLPQLEFKLKSTEETERIGSVSLLARMFSEKGSTLARNHRQLWLAFLGRYNDISVAIRIKCVQYTMHFLLNHPDLIEDITDTLKLRQHDSEETVRYEVVMAIVSAAKKNFEVISRSEKLLHFVRERMLDKKFKIRKEAVSGLGYIYKHYLTSDPDSHSESIKKAITWIRNKILHGKCQVICQLPNVSPSVAPSKTKLSLSVPGYYMPQMEDRLLVERLINTCLVPYDLGPKERMKKLVLLYAHIDDNASKAFIEVQKNQFLIVRKCVADLVAMHRPDATVEQRELNQAVLAASKHLPDSMKALEYVKRFSKHLQDSQVLQIMERIVDPEVSCSECMTNVVRLDHSKGVGSDQRCECVSQRVLDHYSTFSSRISC
jgi:sister-chromatid-cohesion protein PDS5